MTEEIETVDLLGVLRASINRHQAPRDGVRSAATATKPRSEGSSAREEVSEPLRLNPTTSLSMIYLREFERTHSTMRGHVRIARKAGHMLRMHWAYVQCRRLAEWSES